MDAEDTGTTSSTSSQINHARIPTSSSCLRAPPRCDQCNPRRTRNGRNLVVCIDGTSNQMGDHHTNVVKLFSKIDPETTSLEQFAYYTSGIGTKPSNIPTPMGRAIFEKLDMAFAWTIQDNIKETYSWLVRMYQEGDQIYLFGFSRGAYQVRVLTDMISKIGLIRSPTKEQITRACDQYEAFRSGKPEAKQIAREFKNIFSWSHTRVHFVGVWDTVSSVGLVRDSNFLSASLSAENACHFRHALALDELRVKFMPEHFHEMNSQTNDVMSECIVPFSRHIASQTSERRESTVSDNGTNLSEGRKSKKTEIKEVWFAGCHSDVGGMDPNGKPYLSGNVSLLWMRREATACGLVLLPTDIVWVPDDIDLGINDSMTRAWKLIERIPITHQVSYSGSGENSRRSHELRPRRIIPGQKVHASILYANTYRPRAYLGKGFDIHMVHSDIDMGHDGQLWETGLFDDTAAQELVAYLGGQQGVAPVYLDRLLFMLRFKEGKQSVRNVPDWHNQFLNLIHNRDCTPLVRLVTIIAYYEASCDPDAHLGSSALPHVELSNELFDDLKEGLRAILDKPKHRDGPRIIPPLRPLTRHQVLRERILTQDTLGTLMNLLDVVITETNGNFGQAMDGLACLLRCEDTREVIIEKLGATLPSTDTTRLSRILEIKDPHLLTVALRMVVTLARIPEAKHVCLTVKPRLGRLVRKDKQLAGLLSAEILLALYDPNEQSQLDIHNGNVRANLAGALARLSSDRHDSSDHGRAVFSELFGVDTEALTEIHKKLIGELKLAVQNGNTRERTAATLTLLYLCESEIVRKFLREIDLFNVFINQLRNKGKALLAAYALATCLKYGDTKKIMQDNEILPQSIVAMLRLDYFDDAVGAVEGFQIFGEFMQDDRLREKIKKFDITAILNTKLAKGKLKEARPSLICLDIFRATDKDGPSNATLVEMSLQYLKKPDWKARKAGVVILAALAQTEQGVAVINPRVYEIVEMLLPEGYLSVLQTAQEASIANGTSPGEAQTQPAVTPAAAASPESPDLPSRPPSWMMGPACALYILARNEKLRNTMRSTLHYASLKHLYLTEKLIDKVDTRPWQVYTPNRADVIDAIDRVIRSVDEELWEEGLMSIGNTMLPHIVHWDRLEGIFRNGTLATISLFSGLLYFLALGIPAAVVGLPVYLSVRVIETVEKLLTHYQDSQILDKLRNDVHIPEIHMPEVRIPGVHLPGAAQPALEGAGKDGGDGASTGPHNGGRSPGTRLRLPSVAQKWKRRSTRQVDE